VRPIPGPVGEAGSISWKQHGCDGNYDGTSLVEQTGFFGRKDAAEGSEWNLFPASFQAGPNTFFGHEESKKKSLPHSLLRPRNKEAERFGTTFLFAGTTPDWVRNHAGQYRGATKWQAKSCTPKRAEYRKNGWTLACHPPRIFQAPWRCAPLSMRSNRLQKPRRRLLYGAMGNFTLDPSNPWPKPAPARYPLIDLPSLHALWDSTNAGPGLLSSPAFENRFRRPEFATGLSLSLADVNSKRV